ncbi:MAG TPA: hypothetical protein DCE55_25120 [Planctomycetaceae bacterium]|nr:hypothetical protein [Planctomycetaceae bacterium]
MSDQSPQQPSLLGIQRTRTGQSVALRFLFESQGCGVTSFWLLPPDVKARPGRKHAFWVMARVSQLLPLLLSEHQSRPVFR